MLKLAFKALVSLAAMALLTGAVAGAAAVTVPQTYNADDAVQPGMVVALSKDGSKVVALKNKDSTDALGVVIPLSEAPVSVTPAAGSAEQVVVASSGTHAVLVSDQNGPVKNGDYLTLSSVAGIVMKADANQSRVVGRATDDFDGRANVITTMPLKGALGHTTSVAIGRVTANIALAANPLRQNDNNVSGFLTRAANSFSNKPVGKVRVYLSVVVLLGALFIAGNMLYGAVRNGIQAIGRNPLAKKDIVRGLMQVVGIAVAFFAVGVLAVYLILNY